jgi:YaiO family outer membrane protein
MQKKFHILMVLVVVWMGQLNAQDVQDIDAAFNVARKKAFDGKYDEAREMLKVILTHNPEYDDARVLLGRTYAWEKRFDEARRELTLVLEKKPDHADATDALVDVESWSGNFRSAVETSDKGLERFPSSEHFLYNKAFGLFQLGNHEEASAPLARLLAVNPSHIKGLQLQAALKDAAMKYTVGANLAMDFFSVIFEPASYASIQIGRNNKWGASTIRVNYANRFDREGIQPEIELYPKLSTGVYLYLNYGFSNSELFPEHRVGVELYTKIPKGFEASAGIRYLNYDNSITIYTGTLTKYFRHLYLSYRPYIIPESKRTFYSHVLTARYYFKTTDNYVSVSGGLGFLPDERRIQTSSGLASTPIHGLDFRRVGVYYQQSLLNSLILLCSLDLMRQEYIPEENQDLNITSAMIGFRKRF